MSLSSKHRPKLYGFAQLTLILIGMGTPSLIPNDGPLANGRDLSPKGVIETFCQLDAEGQRIEPDGWLKIKPLVAWPDEPGWDNAIIISHFSIVQTNTIGSKSTVTVNYFVLGLTNTVEYVKSSKVQTIKFELSFENGRWKIVGPQIPPHVNRKTMIEHLQGLQLTETKRKDQLEMLIDQIMRSE